MIEDAAAPALFLNRELSWLEFNARVLHEALDDRTPLLERLKFLAIFSSNLDEFYQVRVAGLRRQVAAGVQHAPADGMSPSAQLEAIEVKVRAMIASARDCLHDVLLPALDRFDVRLVEMQSLTPDEQLEMDRFFEREVFPVLTPLAVDPGHPFPYISNLSLSLAVELRDPSRGGDHFARVKVPRSMPRWIPTGRPNHFVPLEKVIGAHLVTLFPGMEILSWHTFKITRYSDLDVPAADEPEDLLATIEEQVFQRRFGEVVRLEVQTGMPVHIRQLLLDELREVSDPEVLPLADSDVHEPGPLLELGDLLSLAALEIPELRDPPFTPVTPPELRDPTRSIFAAIREQAILVHHPFESFSTSVERFFEAASQDELVLAIKTTLYRTSGDSAIVKALTDAAQRGKQVAVLVELQARGDEANNISWARTLENFGVHVAYGLPGLKTHAKIALVVRREPDGIRRYVHIGTGNYNAKTARLYTDFGLLTCQPDIGADLSDVFNLLTGFSRQRDYRKVLVAPASMKARFIALIRREAEHAAAGRPSRIIAKLNALVSPGHHHRVVCSVAGGRGDRPDSPRDLLPASAAPRRERAHSRAEHHRAIPRALASLLLLQWRGRGVLHRLCRLDAAQPRTARGGDRPGRGAGAAAAPPLAPADLPRRQPAGVGAAPGRALRAARGRSRGGAGDAPQAPARPVGARSRRLALHHVGASRDAQADPSRGGAGTGQDQRTRGA